jgi:glycosyltransferase involved in cell wall biosynthesis
MRVHIVDPSAYTPPYDHALACALARAGARVELYTSRFTYGAVPSPEGYLRHEHFYRLAHRRVRAPADAGSGPRASAVRALKLAEHVPDMLGYRRLARDADIVHFQWLTVQPLDLHLLPSRRRRPVRSAEATAAPRPRLVITAHDILPREPRPGQREGQRRLYSRFDAIIAHSERGRRRLTDELGVEAWRVHVIPHGALRPWLSTSTPRAGERRSRSGPASSAPEDLGAQAPPADLPPGFRDVEGVVALFFGLLRPYKGLDVLLEAWRQVRNAELWIVGMPRMDLAVLDAANGGILTHSQAANAPEGATGATQHPSRHESERAFGRVRVLPRFVSAAELYSFLRRASLVVLPYREIDASGAAMTAIGAGAPLLLSDVGAFPEIAATGAARVVPAGDAAALAQALRSLLSDPATLQAMAERARGAAAGIYAWEQVAAQTLALYRTVLGENPRP